MKKQKKKKTREITTTENKNDIDYMNGTTSQKPKLKQNGKKL